MTHLFLSEGMAGDIERSNANECNSRLGWKGGYIEENVLMVLFAERGGWMLDRKTTKKNYPK